jgi:hypothetical protein
MKKPFNWSNMRSLLAESHRLQFAGEDYQAAAIGIADKNGIAYEDEAYTQLMSAPDPGCDCGFCATAPWCD